MQVRATTVLAFVAAVGAAFALGRATSTAPAPTAPPRTAASAEPPAVRVIGGGGAVARLDDADVRRIRDEVVAALASQRAEPAAPPESPAAPAPSPEQVSAGDAGNRVIDSALASREWTDADATALRAQFHEMSIDARVAAARRLAVAVNAGQLRVRVSGPLM